MSSGTPRTSWPWLQSLWYKAGPIPADRYTHDLEQRHIYIPHSKVCPGCWEAETEQVWLGCWGYNDTVGVPAQRLVHIPYCRVLERHMGQFAWLAQQLRSITGHRFVTRNQLSRSLSRRYRASGESKVLQALDRLEPAFSYMGGSQGYYSIWDMFRLGLPACIRCPECRRPEKDRNWHTSWIGALTSAELGSIEWGLKNSIRMYELCSRECAVSYCRKRRKEHQWLIEGKARLKQVRGYLRNRSQEPAPSRRKVSTPGTTSPTS